LALCFACCFAFLPTGIATKLCPCGCMCVWCRCWGIRVSAIWHSQSLWGTFCRTYWWLWHDGWVRQPLHALCWRHWWNDTGESWSPHPCWWVWWAGCGVLRCSRQMSFFLVVPAAGVVGCSSRCGGMF
jgi:hypothetical protein